jgi:TatD DNase family protein
MSKQKRAIPIYTHPIIETHFHLDYLKSATVNEILDKARRVGVEKFITIGVSPDNLPTVIELTQQHSDVYGTLGVHPHDAQLFTNETDSFICDNIKKPKILAVGEIGLDYFHEHSDRKTQRAVFERQLHIAIEHQLPVVIHTREADQDTHDILKELSPLLNAHNKNIKGVIHSFTSGMALAESCVEFGFCIGINGISTFNKADNVREIIKNIPMNALLLETDSPYLTPSPYRGKNSRGEKYRCRICIKSNLSKFT